MLEWSLVEKHGSWCVLSVKRDASCDCPLPESPHPRCASQIQLPVQLQDVASSLQQC